MLLSECSLKLFKNLLTNKSNLVLFFLYFALSCWKSPFMLIKVHYPRVLCQPVFSKYIIKHIFRVLSYQDLIKFSTMKNTPWSVVGFATDLNCSLFWIPAANNVITFTKYQHQNWGCCTCVSKLWDFWKRPKSVTIQKTPKKRFIPEIKIDNYDIILMELWNYLFFSNINP